jgi:hypothetical protein
LLNYRAPEGDPGGIVYGTPTVATDLINGALAKAGAPGLSTGVTRLFLPFSPSKTDGSSWIAYAGQVAYAAGDILWQHTNGGIMSANLTTQGLTPYAHYVVGRDEADYVPEVSQEQPPEKVRVTGTTYRIEDVSRPPNSVITENIDGVITRTEIIYQNWGTSSPEVIETVSIPLELMVIGKFVGNRMLFPFKRTTNRKTYDGINRLIEDFTEVEVPSFIYDVLPQTTHLIAVTQTIVEYEFPLFLVSTLSAALERPLRKKTITTRGLANYIDRSGSLNSQTGFVFEDREISTEEWEQKGPELFIHRRSSRTKAKFKQGLLPPRNSPSTFQNPPAPILKPAEKQREELTFTGTATFTNLAGSGYADKLWVITLPSGMATSNAQCAARARTWGSIRQGRQFAISWAADLERGWLENFNPVRRIDFTVPEVGRPYAAATAYSTGAIVFYRGLSYRALSSTTGNLPTNATYWEPANIRTAYLIEALNISIDARSAAIGGRGLEVGRISTNAALPALPSTPGDAPTPGIPDPVPPFDVLITIDIQHQASVSPLTFAATTTSAPAAAHDVSVGQLTFAAASRVYWVAQHAASVRPLTFAAAATARPFVQHDASVSPLTFAATVEGPILVQHDVSVGPLTFAADVVGPLFAQHEVSVGALTFAAAASSFETETNTLLAAFSGSYDNTRKTAINTMIASLKTGGYWSNIIFMIWPGANTADSFINWKTPGTLNATNNGLSVTPFSFYQGNGTSHHADSNVVPSTHLSQNSHTLAHGCWNHQLRANDAAFGSGKASDFGAFGFINMSNNTTRRPSVGLSCVYFGTNIGAGATTQIPGLTNDGIWLASRVGSGDVNVTDWLQTRNKVSLLSTIPNSSASRSTESILLAAKKRSSATEFYSDAKYSFWMFSTQGYGKSDLDAMTDIFETYRDTLTTP